jgi:hypothetical protein
LYSTEKQRTWLAAVIATLPTIETLLPQWRTIKNFPPGVIAVVKMAHALQSLTTDAENLHQQLEANAEDPVDVDKQFPYFRFNVERQAGDTYRFGGCED